MRDSWAEDVRTEARDLSVADAEVLMHRFQHPREAVCRARGRYDDLIKCRIAGFDAYSHVGSHYYIFRIIEIWKRACEDSVKIS